jgi:hypothetical protein
MTPQQQAQAIRIVCGAIVDWRVGFAACRVAEERS